jgi:hypothetical protein
MMVDVEFRTTTSSYGTFHSMKLSDNTYTIHNPDNDTPAIVWHNKQQENYNMGQLHSYDNKPAIVKANGDLYWFKDGLLHRDDNKPSIQLIDGYNAWFKDGKMYHENKKRYI